MEKMNNNTQYSQPAKYRVNPPKLSLKKKKKLEYA